MSKCYDQFECHCHCHTTPGVMHCMPCCSRCPHCGKNIQMFMFERHVNECKDTCPVCAEGILHEQIETSLINPVFANVGEIEVETVFSVCSNCGSEVANAEQTRRNKEAVQEEVAAQLCKSKVTNGEYDSIITMMLTQQLKEETILHELMVATRGQENPEIIKQRIEKIKADKTNEL